MQLYQFLFKVDSNTFLHLETNLWKNFGSDQFSTLLSFCYFGDRDVLQNPCIGGWLQNFELEGGSNQTSDAITLYSYFNNGIDQASSNFFLRDDINQTHLIRDFVPERMSQIYLPGKFRA